MLCERAIRCTQIRDAIGMPCYLVGDPERIVRQPSPIAEATPDSLSFYSRDVASAREAIEQSCAGAVICSPAVGRMLPLSSARTLLLAHNPRLAFIRVMRRYFASLPDQGVHASAIVAEGAQIAAGVYVGPFTSIGRADIGRGTRIDAHVHLYDHVHIGAGVTIKAGAAIGGDGFGYERNECGELEDFPNIGGVVIEDNVSIGSGTCVDRGTLGDTLIGCGSKVDNLVHIAHNAAIGRHCLIVAGAIIGGSATLGDRCFVGPNAWVTNGVQVGADAFITAGAVVTRSVPQGERVTGNFAIAHDRFLQLMRGVR